MSPQISSGYGSAVQFSRDLPSLLRQQEAIAEANQRYQALAAAQAGHAAELNQRGQIASAGIQAEGRQQQYASEAGLEAQQLAAANQLEQQQQHAQLSAWVNAQDMTQADNLRLQRLQQGLSSTMADPTLSEDDRMSVVGMIRAGIEPLQARQSLQLQKHQKQQDALVQAQEQRMRVAEGAQRKFDAMNTQDHTAVIYNPAVLAELGRQFDEANPGLMQGAQALDSLVPGGMASMQAQKSRKEAIEAMAAEHPDGIIGHSVETSPGKKDVVWKKDAADQTEKLQAEREKRFQTAQAHYDKLFNDALGRVDKLKTAAGESTENNIDLAREDLQKKGIFPPTAPGPVEHPKKRFEGNPFMKGRDKPGPQGEVVPAATPKPVEGPAKPETEQKPFDVGDQINNPKKLSTDQTRVMGTLHDLARQAREAPGLSPETRRGFEEHAAWMAESFAKYGSLYEFHKQDPKEYQRWLKAAEMFRALPQAASPAPAKIGASPKYKPMPSWVPRGNPDMATGFTS